MIFKIQNKYIASLSVWLLNRNLKGQYSRARTRFVKRLQERIKEIDSFLKELNDKYVDKDKGGNYRTEIVDGVEIFKFKKDNDKENYLKERIGLMEEDFILDITDSNKKDIDIVKKIVLNTDYKFGPEDSMTPEQKVYASRIAVEYDKWCSSLESIS